MAAISIPQLEEKDIQRFWSKVNKADNNSCWEWTAGRQVSGYGRIGIKGKLYIASRIAYALHYGECPAHLHCCHKCDNPPCVNPYHLFLGTDLDNARDKESKGRVKHARGERNGGGGKLTEAQVMQIRGLLAEGRTLISIAQQFNVTYGLIGHIKHGRAWRYTV